MNIKITVLACLIVLLSTTSLTGCGMVSTAATPTPLPLYMETVLSHADELGTRFSMGVGDDLMTEDVLQELDETMIKPGEDAIKRDPGNMRARLVVAYFHYLAGKVNQGWNELNEIIMMDPELAEPYLVLGDIVYKLALLNMVLQEEYEVNEACGIIFEPGEVSRLLFRQALEYYHTGATLNAGLTRTDGRVEFILYSPDSLERKQKQASKYLAGSRMDLVYYEDVAQAGLWMTEFESPGYGTVLGWSISATYGDSSLAIYSMPCFPNPESPQDYLERGIAYYEYGLYQWALNDFERAIEQDDDFVEAYFRRAGVYYHLKDYEKAIQDFDKTLELNPDNAEALAGRGETYRLLGKIDLALHDLNQSIELDPHLAYAYVVRGRTYFEQNEFELARADLDKALEIEPNYVLARELSGHLYYELQNYDQALADFNKLLDDDPNNVRYLSMRGNVYIAMKDGGLAIADFDKALELDPNDTINGRLYFERGMAHYLAGNREEAVTDLEKHMELHPDSAEQEFIKDILSR